jgi:serine/threonine protein kinase
MAPDASGDAAVSVLNGHFEIWPDSPLPQLDLLRVSAYAARDSRDPLSHSDLLRLRDYGVVSWTREQGCRFVLIYESPAGERLISSLQSQSGPMSEKKVIKEMLAPVTETLSGLAKEGITHRAIRPTNMYLGVEDEDGERVVLGECASVPPAFDQPPAFEPIESLMADPSGRGPGQPADDIYALGVSILALATGKDPAAGRSATQLLAEKMMRGSYHREGPITRWSGLTGCRSLYATSCAGCWKTGPMPDGGSRTCKTGSKTGRRCRPGYPTNTSPNAVFPLAAFRSIIPVPLPPPWRATGTTLP